MARMRRSSTLNIEETLKSFVDLGDQSYREYLGSDADHDDSVQG